jgi:hypothetical protein
LYHQGRSLLFMIVNVSEAHPPTLPWESDDLELLGVLDSVVDDVRSVAPVQAPNEIGTWSLEYLGPGFHVQLRIARRHRQARVDGWMSPARPVTVFLSSLLRQPVVLEAQVSDSGRFEFPVAPTGACRMSFVLPTPGRPPATPPFWI